RPGRAVRLRPAVLTLSVLAAGRGARLRRVEPRARPAGPRPPPSGRPHPAHPRPRPADRTAGPYRPAGGPPPGPAARVRRGLPAALPRGRRGHRRRGDRRFQQARLARVLPRGRGRAGERGAHGSRRPGRGALVEQVGAAPRGRHPDDPVAPGGDRGALARPEPRLPPARPLRRAGDPGAVRGPRRRAAPHPRPAHAAPRPARGTAVLPGRRRGRALGRAHRLRQPHAVRGRHGPAAPRRRLAHRHGAAGPLAGDRAHLAAAAAVRLPPRRAGGRTGGGVSGPSVGVVIPTRGDRPALLRAALAAVLAQRHPGRLEVVVVADGCDAGAVRRQVADLAAHGPRRVRVLGNPGGPHLARARNTGIAALDTEWVAFCDDDDVWLPGRLAAQFAALRADPGADFASCAIEVEYEGRRVPRLAGTDRIGPE